ncbi:hypothetical protein I317_04643 [Kwoniella heveanensis CBS 569]|nr:hypothetical protein I317_04643 [Kwoniella heveanensis CBS 569]
MSDPEYDDYDVFFEDPETLNYLADAETKAIQASQAPAPVPGPSKASTTTTTRFTPRYDHVLAKPKNSPAKKHLNNNAGVASGSTSRNKVKEPRPINTEPGVKSSGFGWEEGGKRSMEGNVERHIEAIKKREAYWGGKADEEESAPPDVVMDGSGRYELGGLGTGSGDEAIITDTRRAQPAALSESLGLAGPTHGVRKFTSEDAVAARRRAMAAAAAAGNATAGPSVPNPAPSQGPLPPRQPISRSNSASSSSRGATPGPQNGFNRPNLTSGPTLHTTNNSANQPQANGQKFGSTRALSRSQSAGAQIFHHRPGNAVAGPSRLPTIPSQSSPRDPGHNDDGVPPASQGSLARSAAIALEAERKKREEAEAELAALKAARLSASRDLSVRHSQEVSRSDSTGGNGDSERRIKELQQQVWAAKGEAETMRRAQREEQQRHLAELEKLRASIQEKDSEIKEREVQQKKALESMKHQAVFSNHAVLNSAVKARQQSQRLPGASQSQFRPMPTPMRNGSPGRRRSDAADVEFTPLVKSVKGKGKAIASTPVPAFGGFNNAFFVTPTVGPRAKRQKTADVSPHTSPSKAAPPSPFQGSPSKSQQRASSPMLGDEDEGDGHAGVDWGINDDAANGMLADDQQAEGRKDEKAEVSAELSIALSTTKADNELWQLLYHLFSHVAVSAFQTSMGYLTEPTIYRIMNYRPPAHFEAHALYAQSCADLLQACAELESSYEQLVEVVTRALSDMLTYMVNIIKDGEKVSSRELAALQCIINLLGTTTLLFPTVTRALASTSITESCRDLVNAIFLDVTVLKKLRTLLAEGQQGPTEDPSDDGLKDREAGSQINWHLELVDVLVELCEAMSLQAERSVWQGDELVDIVLGLTSMKQDSFTVQRGIELFYTSACRGNFRPLITSSEKHRLPGSPDQSPLVERMSRYLINPHLSATEEAVLKMNLLICRGLCMLAMSHPDAVILMGQRSILVAALVTVLQRESTTLYGIHAYLRSPEDALSLLIPALSLLHHMVFPSPGPSSATLPSSAAQPIIQFHDPTANPNLDDQPVGIDLSERLHAAAASREFNGLQHMFVSSLGVMAYGQPGEDMISEADQRTIQFLSGDLLENVVEGPEGDAIYELYVPLDEDEEAALRAADAAGETGAGDGDLEGGGVENEVDEDVYNAVGAHVEDNDEDVIVID